MDRAAAPPRAHRAVYTVYVGDKTQRPEILPLFRCVIAVRPSIGSDVRIGSDTFIIGSDSNGFDD